MYYVCCMMYVVYGTMYNVLCMMYYVWWWWLKMAEADDGCWRWVVMDDYNDDLMADDIDQWWWWRVDAAPDDGCCLCAVMGDVNDENKDGRVCCRGMMMINDDGGCRLNIDINDVWWSCEIMVNGVAYDGVGAVWCCKMNHVSCRMYDVWFVVHVV